MSKSEIFIPVRPSHNRLSADSLQSTWLRMTFALGRALISWLAMTSSTRIIAEWSQAEPPFATQALNRSWVVAVFGSDAPIWRALVRARLRVLSGLAPERIA